MKTFKNTIILLLIVTLLNSCSKEKNPYVLQALFLSSDTIINIDDNNENGDDDINTIVSNNGIILSGQDIGQGITPNNKLVKKVPITLLEENPNFKVSEVAYLCKDRLSDEWISVIIPIENISDKTFRSVEIEHMKYKNSSGQSISQYDYLFVTGDFNKSEGFYETDYLTSGSKGYFLDFKNLNPNNVKSIEINKISSYEHNQKLTALGVKAVDYMYSTEDYPFGEVNLNVKNETNTILRNNFTMVILLDNNDQPLSWDFILPHNSNSNINPNETKKYTCFSGYDGYASKIQIFFNFESTESKQTNSEHIDRVILLKEQKTKYKTKK